MGLGAISRCCALPRFASGGADTFGGEKGRAGGFGSSLRRICFKLRTCADDWLRSCHRVGRAKERTDTSKTAIIGDSGSECRRGSSRTHPGKYDRYVDAEKIAKGSWRRTALAANLRHDSSVAVIRGSR
jgi:hypothetical protein